MPGPRRPRLYTVESKRADQLKSPHKPNAPHSSSKPKSTKGQAATPSRMTPHSNPYRSPVSSFLPSNDLGRPRAAGPTESSDSESAEEDNSFSDDEPLTRSTPARARRSGSEDDEPLTRSTPKRARLSESEDDLPIVSKGKQPEASLPVSRSTPKSTAPVEEEESDDDDLPLPRSSMNRMRTRTSRPAEGSESDEDVISPAKRRRLGKVIPSSSSKPARRGNRDTSESDGDSEPLVRTSKATAPAKKKLKGANGSAQDTPVRRSVRKPGAARSEKDKLREVLRRRRAGENIDEEDLDSSSEPGDDDGGALYDTDSDHPALDEFEDEESSLEQEEEGAAPARPRSSKTTPLAKSKSPKTKRRVDEMDDDDIEDFIVDDDEAPLGVPHQLLIPLELTQGGHRPLKDHFRDALEWLVQKRLNPGFDQNDPVYIQAFRKLEDEVTGLANSKFASSAWKPDFQRALRARPYLNSYELPKGSSFLLPQSCEACGRSGHPATWRLVFLGAPYHRNTLDVIELDDDEDGDDEDEDEDEDDSEAGLDIDENGNPIPPDTKEWYVGAVCRSNADTAHTLMHWKHALKEWVEEALKAEGLLKPDKVVERDGMTRKEKHQLVDSVMEDWDKTGTVKQLWKEFKHTVDMAQTKSTTGRGLARR